MSVRDRFFRKVQQQQSTPVPGGGPVEADIQAFCQRMDELAQQVCGWFDGSGIDVVIGVRPLSDLSTIGYSLNSGASRYDITTIRLQNGIRRADIFPEQLYRNGAKGCVTMMLDTPDRYPVRQRFYLTMAPEGGWYLRREHQTVANKSIMTEDIFFRAIENLA